MSLIEERDAIRDLVARYTLYVDTGRVEEWADLFTKDGELVMGDAPPTAGRQALEDLARNIEPGRMHHYIVNEVIDVDGDQATCECSLLLSSGQPPSFSMVGRYRDDLVKSDGQWRFRRRAVTLDP